MKISSVIAAILLSHRAFSGAFAPVSPAGASSSSTLLRAELMGEPAPTAGPGEPIHINTLEMTKWESDDPQKAVAESWGVDGGWHQHAFINVDGRAQEYHRWTIPAGAKVEPHNHVTTIPVHLHEGTIKITSGGKSWTFEKGDMYAMPGNAIYDLEVIGGGPAIFTCGGCASSHYLWK